MIPMKTLKMNEDVFEITDGKARESLNFDKSATQGYILTADNTGNGTKWSPVGLPTDEQTQEAVNAWLDEHPEASTTVQDGSLTESKFSDSLKLKAIKDYVTPEMYGAKGDGETDDSEAFQTAMAAGALCIILTGKYRIKDVAITKDTFIVGINAEISPLEVEEGSNQFANVFTAENVEVKISCVNFVGLGGAVSATTEKPTLIKTTGGSFTFDVCTFTGFNTKNHNTDFDLFVNRFGMLFTGIDCDRVEFTNCVFDTISGDEIAWVCYESNDITDGALKFSNNTIKDVSGYSFSFFIGDIEITDNHIDNFTATTSLFNIHGMTAALCRNYIINSSCKDIFDASEAGYLRCYDVLCSDNYVDATDAILVKAVGEKLTVVNNYVKGRALVQTFNDCTNNSAVVPPAMVNSAKLEAKSVFISDNYFLYNTTEPTFVVVVHDTTSHAHLYSHVDCKPLEQCVIKDNIIEYPASGVTSGSNIVPIRVFSDIRNVTIEGNIFINVVPDTSISSTKVACIAVRFAYTYYIDRLTVKSNYIENDNSYTSSGKIFVFLHPDSGYEYTNTSILTMIIAGNDADAGSVEQFFANNSFVIGRQLHFTCSVNPSLTNVARSFATGFYDPNTNTCRIYLYLYSSDSIGTTTALFSVPEPYRPRSNTGCMGMMSADTTGGFAPANMVVRSDGDIRQSLSNSCKVVYATLEYNLN